MNLKAIKPTQNEVAPYLDVKWPEGWLAFEWSEIVAGQVTTNIQVISPNDEYKHIWFTRADEHKMLRNHVASEFALWLVSILHPNAKANGRVPLARKLRNV